MSSPGDAQHDDLLDIRRELWSLYARLKHGEMEPEVAEQAISAVDSLLDSLRLELELKGGTDDLGDGKGSRWTLRRR